MRCEELEAIVFSGREIAAEERAEMEAHAETCEACRALMDNADALRGMQRIDENVTPPESFTKGWRMAIRQTPRVISISDWMRRKGVRVVGYAACAALVFAAGTGVGRLGGNEKNEARTAYDYDYGAYDTYEAYPREDAIALYENSAPAPGARSAAEKAGIKPNDIIIRMDGKRITLHTDLTNRLAAHAAGDVVTLTVYRIPGLEKLTLQDAIPAGEELELTITLEMPSQDA